MMDLGREVAEILSVALRHWVDHNSTVGADESSARGALLRTPVLCISILTLGMLGQSDL